MYVARNIHVYGEQKSLSFFFPLPLDEYSILSEVTANRCLISQCGIYGLFLYVSSIRIFNATIYGRRL